MGNGNAVMWEVKSLCCLLSLFKTHVGPSCRKPLWHTEESHHVAQGRCQMDANLNLSSFSLSVQTGYPCLHC